MEMPQGKADMGGSSFDILNDAINLLKEHSLEEARKAIELALKTYEEEGYRARSSKIHEINKSISCLKRQINTICQLVDSFTDDERIYARVNIQETAESLYEDVLCELKAQKRKLSKP